MSIVGAATYLPQGQFAFPRPYISQFTFGFGVGAIIVQSDEQFYITDGLNPFVHVVCNLLPEFWATSSNRYTLDFVVVDWWLIIDPSPLHQPLNFNLKFQHDPVTLKPELYLYLAGATARYSYPLPPPPDDYWTPA